MAKNNMYKGLASILIDFSAWTSTHGVPHIGMANATWLRVIWLIIVSISLIVFIVQVTTIFKRFFSYPVNVLTELEFGEREFPSVTFCNLNPWKIEKAKTGPLGDLINAYSDGINADDFGLNTNYYQKIKIAKKWQHYIHEDMVVTDENGLEASYDYNSLFISCSYNNIACNSTSFQPFYDPFFGRCHIFNYDQKETSSRAGPLYGLRVVLRVRQKESLPWIGSTGAVVFVHSTDETPFADSFGYHVPAGTAASLGVEFVTLDKLASPYSECSDEGGTQKNYYKEAYEVESCIRSCLQDRIIDKCSCYDPSFAVPTTGNPISCGKVINAKEKVSCIFNLTDNDGKTGFDISKECDCPQNCLECYYKVTLSTARWPASAYTPAECVSKINEYVYWDNREECKEFYKGNTVLVEVYYERMNYQTFKESPGYPFINMVSDVGGQVGLWLGMSVISVIEFITLTILLICYCLTRPTDAYHPSFDNKEKLEKDRMIKEYLEQQEKGSLDLYKNNNDYELPPKITSPR